MLDHVFEMTPERHLQRRSAADVRELTEADSPLWVDIPRRDSAELRRLLEAIGVHPLAIEACLDPHPAALFAAYGDSLFFAIPVYPCWDAEERLFLWIVCRPRILVTIHEGPIPALNEIVARYGNGLRFHHRGASAILYQILDYIAGEDMSFTLKARDAIDRLDELLDEDAVDELIERAIPLKRQLTRLAAAYEDHLYCVSALQTVEAEPFNIAELHEGLRDTFLHLEHTSRVGGRQLAHLNSIQQQYQLKLQDKANDRLRLLTIISTIFLPLTLIAGIYGMNFRYMPELEWRQGYPAVLVAMLLIAAGMLWQFYRRGWFR